MNVRSLRFKLSWTNGLAIALVVVCFGLVRYQMVSYRSKSSFDADLLADAQFFASHFQYGSSGFSWTIQGLTPGDALSLEELAPYFVLTDMQGRVLREDLHSRYMQAMLKRKGLDEVLLQQSGFGRAVAADGTDYRFVSIPMSDSASHPQAVLHVGRSMESLAGVLNEYVIIYIYSVPWILAVSVAIGWLLAGRALIPFEEVAHVAQQINSENLNTQITSKHMEAEVQRLVQAFNGMVSRLNQSFQQMRKFNADAAHELRTPLAILQGENEIALRSPNLPDEVGAVLASNLEELARLTRIVNDMLTLAEAEAGNQVLAMEPIGLRTLLEDLVEQMRLLATDRDIRIELIDLPDVVIDADKLWFRRAVINLLDNAIKYSKDGGLVEVRVVVHGAVVRLIVRDYGMGIGPVDLPHIFDRLYRADPARTRSTGGAGLGLTLVRWIIEAHQGTIQVTSQIDHGTSFEILLPVAAGKHKFSADRTASPSIEFQGKESVKSL